MAEDFAWVPIYEAIATKLLEYEDRQDELAVIVEKVLNEHYEKMDPLTFFSMFNGKRINYGSRSKAVRTVLDGLGIVAEAPTEFEGVPTTNAQRWRYWNGQPGNIEKNWAVFRAAIALTDSADSSDELRQDFVECFNAAVAQNNVGEASLTMALYWARPKAFLPLDGNTSMYLRNRFNLTSHPIDGMKYLALIESVRQRLDGTHKDFAHISFVAWEKGGWIPAPSEYDPQVPAERWIELLADPSIGTPTALTALKCLNEHPKGATCTELSEFYGRTSDFYSNNLSVLGENVCKYAGVPPREVVNGGKYWPVVCLGNYVGKRRHGTFEWRLRDEVREALKSVDLSRIVLKASDETTVPEYDAGRFKRLLCLYKKDFFTFRGPNGPEGDRETYKWANLVTFQKNWDLDAENLRDMIERSLRPSAMGSGTLLDNRHERPYNNLLKFAEFDAEAVREAFRKLFDDDANAQMAYAGFSRDMTDLLARYNMGAEVPLSSDDQTPKAASIYLAFEKPERYYLYKYTLAEGFSDAIGAKLSTDQIGRFCEYEALCDALLPMVVSDRELLDLADSVLTQEQRDADSAHHLLMQDIAYYAFRYMQEMNENWKAVLSGEEAIVMPDDNYNTAPEYHKNMILYGPPGTGKTYQTRAYAVAICDGLDVEVVLQQMKTAEGSAAVLRRYQELVDERRIGFTTFHQSYGYEEFIEGIRPVVVTEDEAEESSSGGVAYSTQDGIFKKFCTRASNPVIREEVVDFGFNDDPTVWKVSLEGTGDNPTRTECLNGGHIRIGWDTYGPTITDETDFSKDGGKTVLNAFITKMRKGDIVLSCYSSTTIDAVGVVTGDVEWHEEYEKYRRLRTVNWLARGLSFDIVNEFGIPTLTLSTVYRLKLDASQVVSVLGKVGALKRKVTARETLPYVFVIDEVNRGNISKIFGELITLLEDDKRKGESQELSVTLPYSDEPFSVPSNVCVIGTMNTADRSIAQMDTALRRRFTFKEIMPDSSVLEGIEVEGIDIARMLDVMNNRIELLFDREHTLGHAFFIGMKNDSSKRTVAYLSDVFRNSLMPLLQEYFFDDYTKIASVLGAAAGDFLEPLKSENVFWKGDNDAPDRAQGYRIKETPTIADAYKRIYQIEREG